MNERTLVSLFSGAGGLDLGLERAGFATVMCVENDEDARRTLTKNRPGWPQAEPGDIHKLAPKALLQQASLRAGELTLLAGGPPCQPFSKSAYWSNGNGGRLRDPRARTLGAYLRIVEAALPQVLLLENVKGLVYAGKDEGFRLLQRGILRINREHGMNYRLQAVHLNSADYGVPQNRERVFVLANIDGHLLQAPQPTHGAETGLKPFRTAWDAIGDLAVC